MTKPISETLCFSPFALLALFVTGCADNSTTLPPRFATGLTLVALSEDGSLIDAVSIPVDDSIASVVFRVPEHLERMQLVLWGDRINASIPSDAYFITSSEALGGNGLIRVHLRGGIVTAVDGNGYGSPAPLTPVLVDAVAKLLDSGVGPKATTEIHRE